jgi:hypothetical protein
VNRRNLLDDVVANFAVQVCQVDPTLICVGGRNAVGKRRMVLATCPESPQLEFAEECQAAEFWTCDERSRHRLSPEQIVQEIISAPDRKVRFLGLLDFIE